VNRCGNGLTLETRAAVAILREEVLGLLARAVPAVDLMKRQPQSEPANGLGGEALHARRTRGSHAASR
jgi:phosphoketolase